MIDCKLHKKNMYFSYVSPFKRSYAIVKNRKHRQRYHNDHIQSLSLHVSKTQPLHPIYLNSSSSKVRNINITIKVFDSWWVKKRGSSTKNDRSYYKLDKEVIQHKSLLSMFVLMGTLFKNSTSGSISLF